MGERIITVILFNKITSQWAIVWKWNLDLCTYVISNQSLLIIFYLDTWDFEEFWWFWQIRINSDGFLFKCQKFLQMGRLFDLGTVCFPPTIILVFPFKTYSKHHTICIRKSTKDRTCAFFNLKNKCFCHHRYTILESKAVRICLFSFHNIS